MVSLTLFLAAFGPSSTRYSYASWQRRRFTRVNVLLLYMYLGMNVNVNVNWEIHFPKD